MNDPFEHPRLFFLCLLAWWALFFLPPTISANIYQLSIAPFYLGNPHWAVTAFISACQACMGLVVLLTAYGAVELMRWLLKSLCDAIQGK